MATCPICEEYEGKPEQVEAHISSVCDDQHKGKIGKEFASVIEAGGSVEIEPENVVDEESVVESEEDSEEDSPNVGIPVSLAAVAVVLFLVIAMAQFAAHRRRSRRMESEEGLYNGA